MLAAQILRDIPEILRYSREPTFEVFELPCFLTAVEAQPSTAAAAYMCYDSPPFVLGFVKTGQNFSNKEIGRFPSVPTEAWSGGFSSDIFSSWVSITALRKGRVRGV